MSPGSGHLDRPSPHGSRVLGRQLGLRCLPRPQASTVAIWATDITWCLNCFRVLYQGWPLAVAQAQKWPWTQVSSLFLTTIASSDLPLSVAHEVLHLSSTSPPCTRSPQWCLIAWCHRWQVALCWDLPQPALWHGVELWLLLCCGPGARVPGEAPNWVLSPPASWHGSELLLCWNPRATLNSYSPVSTSLDTCHRASFTWYLELSPALPIC